MNQTQCMQGKFNEVTLQKVLGFFSGENCWWYKRFLLLPCRSQGKLKYQTQSWNLLMRLWSL